MVPGPIRDVAPGGLLCWPDRSRIREVGSFPVERESKQPCLAKQALVLASTSFVNRRAPKPTSEPAQTCGCPRGDFEHFVSSRAQELNDSRVLGYSADNGLAHVCR